MAEKRMIDAYKLIEALPIETEDKQISLHGAVADFMVMISEMPTVDAVEVVRCKDCIRYKNDVACSKHSRGSCEFDNERKSRNHFCSYGERRTDG